MIFKNGTISLLHSKEPTTDPVQNVSSLQQTTFVFSIHPKSLIYSCLAISLFPSGFPTKIVYAFHFCSMQIRQTEIQHYI